MHKKLYENDNFFDFHNETDWVGKRIEIQANIFAKMLMMPRKLIYQKWQKVFFHIENHHQKIYEMMKFFKTSGSVILIVFFYSSFCQFAKRLTGYFCQFCISKSFTTIKT